MKKLLTFLFGAAPVFAADYFTNTTAVLTPMQLVWSIFAVAAIVILFIMYHMHLEHAKKRRR